MRYQTKTLTDPFGNITYGSLAQEEVYPFLRNDYISTPFVLECAGITYPDGNYYIERKHNDYYVLEFVASGKGYVFANNKEYTVGAGDVYLLKKGNSHRYGADKRDPYKKLWVNIFSGSAEAVEPLLRGYGIEDDLVIHAPKCQIFFEELIKIAETSKLYDDIALEATLVIFKILTEIAQACYKKRANPALAQEVKIHLDASLHEQVNIESLAASLHVSKAHLINEFKRCYKETPYSYFLSRKIDTAKTLLKHTSLRINEIALSLRFNDGHHFSNIFKKKTGISPEEYRRREHSNG